jgi:hypothetical protein
VSSWHTGKVDMNARRQYLDQIRREYARAGKAEKGKLLDEAERRTGLHRKYLIRWLGNENNGVDRKGGKPQRKRVRKYGAAVMTALVQLWELFDYPCGQRLAPALRTEVERLRELGELRVTDEVAERLRDISPKTIDRLLAREKRVRGLQRNRNPWVHRLNYQRVPVKVAADWDTADIGNLQVDFVPHCGRSMGGDFIHTLSTVDIATGWWEGQAIAARTQQQTRAGLEQIRPRFPFPVKEIHPDNDSAMINDLLWDWCQQARIRMSRSRPYKKNDNAWVEQKNWTHVRKVVGYRRYDTTTELRLLNEIYSLSRLYRNFFQPVIKLLRKTRVHGRIQRCYDTARTPYQRVMASPQTSRSAKLQLRQLYETLNPAEMRRQLDQLLERLSEASHSKGDVVHKPARHGPAISVSKWRRRRRSSG